MDQIGIDTNVLVAGLRSNKGASHQLLRRVGEAGAGFEINLSVPLVLEYEMALVRDPVIDSATVDATIAWFCSVGRPREIYYLWRPFLRDPSDEMVLEVAVESQSTVIVTHNVKDFKGVEEKFGIRIIRPGEFLTHVRERFK